METYVQRRLERNVLSTLLTNKGRDDVVVLLDRAVGARRERREGRHHDLRLCVDGAQMIKLAPVATAYISAKHRSVPVVGENIFSATIATVFALPTLHRRDRVPEII